LADIYSAIILDDDYWDGTVSWAGEVSEAARDSKYSTRRFTSLSAWESDRDGNAAAADPEYANIFGPWTSHDTTEFLFSGWTNKPAITIQTIGTDARSQTGLFDANNCYVLENDSAGRCIDIDETGHTITIIGVQFQCTNVSGDMMILNNNYADLTIEKCFFDESGDGGSKGIWSYGGNHDLTVKNSIFDGCAEAMKGGVGTGAAKLYNNTSYGSGSGDGFEDDGGTWTARRLWRLE